jgi:iron complex outermembrane receptor protein
MNFIRILLFASSFFASSLLSHAAELRGKITNAQDGSAVIGTRVRIDVLNIETVADVNGEYTLRDIPVGRHAVAFSAPGYVPFSYELVVEKADRSFGRNVELQENPWHRGEVIIATEEPRFRLPEVQVLTTRATSEHPVTFTNLSQQEIRQESYGQDLPLLLSELPNVSTYSEGGAGMGYSYLRMRGFGQERVAVQINGVPLNDAETHEVFWVDLPDFQQDLADMQVQRGVGSSLYGPAAFGGSINLVTRTPGLGDRPLIRAEGTYGSWNTQRAMVQFQSGRIQNRYGIAGRFTRMQTDGYRFNSWAKLWSYYLSGARFTPHHTTRVIFYGGPEQTHLAYEGVTKDFLEGKVTGNKENDRRFNEFQYPGEIDNFFQPHYELHDDWKLSDRVTLDNSLYLFKGDGYYDQYRADDQPYEYFPHQQVFPQVLIDVLRRRNVSEMDGGWIPRASIEHPYGTTVIGGDVRLHRAHHEGILTWSNWGSTPPDYHYYDYRIQKNSASAYVHNLFRITARLHALADVQVVSHQIEMKKDTVWNVRFEKNYTTFNPRAGLRYLLMQGHPSASVYASISRAQREPKPRDIYDPQDYYQTPSQQAGHFADGALGGAYVGSSLSPEKLTDVELGTQWSWKRMNLGANVYYLSLRDEQVPYGAIDNLGLYIPINAKETVHQGLEFVAGVDPLNGLRVNGNLSVADDHFVRHQELSYDSLGNPIYVSRNGNRIAFDPLYVANARVEYDYRGATAGLGVRSVGKQYIDNTQDEATAVSAYTLVSIDLGYRYTGIPGLAAADLKLRVNNLFNSEYEAFGYNYPDPRYIVGAPRSLMATMGVEL